MLLTLLGVLVSVTISHPESCPQDEKNLTIKACHIYKIVFPVEYLRNLKKKKISK